MAVDTRIETNGSDSGEAGAWQTMRMLVCGGRYFQNVVRLWRVLDDFHANHTIAGVSKAVLMPWPGNIASKRAAGIDVHEVADED